MPNSEETEGACSEIYRQTSRKLNAFVIRVLRFTHQRSRFRSLIVYESIIGEYRQTSCVVSNFWVAIGRKRFRFDTP